MNPRILFRASCVALITTAMSFAIRGEIMGDLGRQFSLNNEELGHIAATAFWGFTLAMIFGGPLCDILGMKRLITLAFAGHLVGISATILAGGFWALFAGTLGIGIANVPGGIVIGGLGAYLLGWAGLGWQWKMALMYLPLLGYGILFWGKILPHTERITSGVSTRAMFQACLKPVFLLMVFCMFLTASTELGPNQWIPNILSATAGFSGILILVWINGIMALGRQFCGPVVHRLAPGGMLLFSSVFALLGLLCLGLARQPAAVIASATLFSVGVCYFWPTMLGFTAERSPKTGALGLAIMGGAGMLSLAWVLPLMGHIYDQKILAALPPGADAGLLKNALPGSADALLWSAALAQGGAETLLSVAVLPALLVVIFAGLAFCDWKRGGYKAEIISAPSGRPKA